MTALSREEAEVAILSLLADLRPNEHMDRLSIGAAVFAKNGGTFAASVIGSLLNRQLISRPSPDPGPRCQRYRITPYGRAALELHASMTTEVAS